MYHYSIPYIGKLIIKEVMTAQGHLPRKINDKAICQNLVDRHQCPHWQRSPHHATSLLEEIRGVQVPYGVPDNWREVFPMAGPPS